MKNFESWFEKKVTRGRDEYWELEEDLCKTTWRAALEWALSKATHSRVECNVIKDELEEVE